MTGLARPAAWLVLVALAWLSHAGDAAHLARSLLIKEDPPSGPPETVPFDDTLVPKMPSLGLDSPALQRQVTGFQPEQVKVTYWGPGQVLVGWATGEERVGPLSSPPQPYDPASLSSEVVYWEEGREERVLRAESEERRVYSKAYPEPLGGTSYQSPILHHVLLSGLTPGATYHYYAGDPHHGWSEHYSFKLPAAPSAHSALPLRLGLMGDLGQSANSTTTLRHLAAHAPDILIVPGDLSYADQHLADGSANTEYVYSADSRRWDSWGRMMQPVIARVPFLATPGNHELEIEADGKAQVSYNARCPMPQHASRINTASVDVSAWLGLTAGTVPPVPPPGLEAKFKAHNSFYSVDLPGCHIITLSSYVPYGNTSQQYRWLLRDMGAVDRSVTPWLLVVMHAPFYSSYAQLWKQNEFMRSVYEPVFYKYGVDLVLNGHMHAYERTRPVYNYQLDECAPAYLTVGDGGNEEGVERTFIEQQPQPDFCADQAAFQPWFFSQQNTPTGKPLFTYQDGKYCPDAQPKWSAWRDPSFGHGILELLNVTHASWRWHRNQDGLATVSDSVLYVRNADCGLAALDWPADARAVAME